MSYNIWNDAHKRWTGNSHPKFGLQVSSKPFELSLEEATEWFTHTDFNDKYFKYEVREIPVVCKQDCCKIL